MVDKKWEVGSIIGVPDAVRWDEKINPQQLEQKLAEIKKGNVSTADKWKEKRKITLAGDLLGNSELDGSSDVTLSGSVKQASLTQAGKVQLTEAVTSTSITTAATPSSVKMVYDATKSTEIALNQHNDNKSNPHNVSKNQVGLGSVDNIQQAPKIEFNAHVANKNNPHNVTKNQIGLEAVDNTKQYPQTGGILNGDLLLKTGDTRIRAGGNGGTLVSEAKESIILRSGVTSSGTEGKGVLSLEANGELTNNGVKVATISDNVSSATKLQFPRTINGVQFDGTGNIEITANPTVNKIYENTDLNMLLTAGMYTCSVSASVLTLKNCPTSVAFSLVIEKHAGTKQTVHESVIAGQKTWERNFYSNKWGDWIEIPKSNGILQTNLYAQSADKLATVRAINGIGFDGTKDINITKSQIALGNVDNVQQATKAEFNSHNNDLNRHVTAIEKGNWDSKAAGTHTHTISQIGDLQNQLNLKAPNGFGLGTDCKNVSSQDCNNQILTGFYMGSAMINKPVDATQGWIYLFVMRHSDTFINQIATDFATGKQFSRVKNNGNWTLWSEFETTVGAQKRADLIQTNLTTHAINKENPHFVSKSQIGLGSVDNIQQATKAEFNSHITNKSNPHGVTAAQLSVYTKAEANTLVGSANKDTGWKQASIGGGASAQFLYYRRIGNVVYLNGRGKISSTTVAGLVWAIPVGYRPSRSVLVNTQPHTNIMDVRQIMQATGDRLQIVYNLQNTVEYSFDQIFWITNETFPG